MRRIAPRRFAPLAIAALTAVFAATAAANTINVQNTHDHGAGSLRTAFANANPGDTVKVPKGHYGVTSGELLIDNPVTVKGASARKTVIDANGDSRVVEVDAGPGTVRFQKLTIRNGDTDGMGSGAGIEVHSSNKLVLTRVAVLDNRAITSTDFDNGGGVYGGGEVVIKQSLFAGNHAYNGGAVEASSGTRATDSTFFNNFGGNPNFNGDGGAFDDTVTLIDSTVVGNQCFNNDGCGGGIAGGSATLKGTLLADNKAFDFNGMPAGSPGNPGTNDNCGNGTPTSQGHNLDDHHDCSLAGTGDVSDENPHVGPLANNGGQTNTLSIPGSSPAFNAGDTSCTGRDQRGVHRPQGPRCDIGAFERVP